MRCVWCGCVRHALAGILLWVLAAGPAASPASARDAQVSEVASSLAASPAPPGVRLVWNAGSEDPAQTLERLGRAGFRVAVALPPHVYYVHRESVGRGSLLPAGFSFQDGEGATLAPRAAPPGMPGQPSAAPGGADFDPFQGREDAFPPSPRTSPGLRSRIPRSGALQGLPFGARWKDTSEFMIGRVAVSILFPESDGTTDPNRYDWTPTLRDSVVRSAVRGLAKWSVFAAARGIALSFAIEVHTGLATRYEPIDRTVGEEDNWIQDMLTGFAGYRSDALTLEYDIANAARSRLGAQWSVLILAVQNDTDPDGAFADGFIAHAILGGPYFVVPVNNLNTTSASLDFYIEHEIAHSFWALDEHFPSNAWWSCQLTTGYLNQPNSNSVVPGPGYCGVYPPLACLMYANYPGSVCDYTQRQIGWADRDGNGTPDLIETRPAAVPDSEQYRAVAGPPITLGGRAFDIALPNQNPYHFFVGDTISIATIDSVTYRVNGGPPNRATPWDGVWDSGLEFFTATLPALPPGDYTVEWEAWNSNGLANTALTLVSLRAPTSPAGAGGGASAPRGLSLRIGPTPSRGPVRFTLGAPPGSRGWGRIHDVRGREVARWRLEIPSSGTADWRWEGRVAGGAVMPSGLYFVSIEIDGATLRRRLVISH